VISKGRLWKQGALSIGAHLGTGGELAVLGTLTDKGRLWTRFVSLSLSLSLSMRAQRGEPAGRVPLRQTLKDI